MVVLSLALLGYNAWTYVRTNQLFYDYLFGAYGLQTYIWQQSADATAVRHAFLASPLAYYILVGVAATVGGLAVYTLLQGLSLLSSGTRRVWRELDTLGPTRRAIAMALLSRWALRSVSLVGWAFFGAFFVSTLLPFVLVLNQTGIGHVHSGQPLGWLACALALAILAFSLHLQVVFTRLVFLRPRLFFGDRAIEEAEAEDRSPHI